MTNWQAKLAERRQSSAKRPGDSLTKPTKPGFVSFGGSPDPPSEAVEALRATLAQLATDEGIPGALVTQLAPADVAACAGLPEPTLRAYLRALERTAKLARGETPHGWTRAAECSGCGPVWLAAGSPARVIACPWCWHRKSGVTLPRPPVRCGGCKHFRPDPLNPAGGFGGCAITGKPSNFPEALHDCADHREASKP